MCLKKQLTTDLNHLRFYCLTIITLQKRYKRGVTLSIQINFMSDLGHATRCLHTIPESVVWKYARPIPPLPSSIFELSWEINKKSCNALESRTQRFVHFQVKGLRKGDDPFHGVPIWVTGPLLYYLHGAPPTPPTPKKKFHFFSLIY